MLAMLAPPGGAVQADMERANQAILRLTGRKARGYRSPSWT
jgi:peptidoglycan/xylan/chitin deacetylase (PgdA/CDA1 family)